MRPWIVVAVTAVSSIAISAPTAGAGSRTGTRPAAYGKVSVSASGNTVRYIRSLGGTLRVKPPVKVSRPSVVCRRWTVFETVGVEPNQTVVEHYWRLCYSASTGRPIGDAKEIGGDVTGTPGTDDVWTAVVPDPVIMRENQVRFVTQRVAYLWLPAEYFHGIRVDLRSDSGAVLKGAAIARATQVMINPGWGGEANSTDCTLEAQFPYDRSVGYWDQRSCGLVYMKSSIDEPGGVYTATATVTWEVTATIDGLPVDAAVVVTEGETPVRVEELQALVTCTGGGESSCPAQGGTNVQANKK